jgi:hypothetical protein
MLGVRHDTTQVVCHEIVVSQRAARRLDVSVRHNHDEPILTEPVPKRL